MVWLAGTRILRPLPGEGKKVDPRGPNSYQQQLLEAVKYEIYKMEAYRLRNNGKMTCWKLWNLELLQDMMIRTHMLRSLVAPDKQGPADIIIIPLY